MKEELDIKSAIKQHGLTVNEVANRLGVNRLTLTSQIKGNPSVDTLNRIAEAIGCNTTDLFRKADEHYIICPNCGTKLKVIKEEQQ